jgi:hypothetical protein
MCYKFVCSKRHCFPSLIESVVFFTFYTSCFTIRLIQKYYTNIIYFLMVYLFYYLHKKVNKTNDQTTSLKVKKTTLLMRRRKYVLSVFDESYALQFLCYKFLTSLPIFFMQFFFPLFCHFAYLPFLCFFLFLCFLFLRSKQALRWREYCIVCFRIWEEGEVKLRAKANKLGTLSENILQD